MEAMEVPLFWEIDHGLFWLQLCEISVLSVVCPVLSPVFIRKYQDFVYLYIASLLFAHDGWHTMRVRPLWSLFS